MEFRSGGSRTQGHNALGFIAEYCGVCRIERIATDPIGRSVVRKDSIKRRRALNGRDRFPTWGSRGLGFRSRATASGLLSPLRAAYWLTSAGRQPSARASFWDPPPGRLE
jgi:hypothetical protein